MSRAPVIGLVMSTIMEANPFILDLKLDQCETSPFKIFCRENIRLIITGIGKANSAMASSYFIHTYDPSVLCNLGAAGATDNRLLLGECCQVEKIIEPDRPDLDTDFPSEHLPDILDGFTSVTLATHDKAVKESSEREKVARVAQLVDMEAASVVQTCRCFHKSCHVFKFVSDTPAHSHSNDIRTNISLYREAFYRFFRDNVLLKLE